MFHFLQLAIFILKFRAKIIRTSIFVFIQINYSLSMKFFTLKSYIEFEMVQILRKRQCFKANSCFNLSNNDPSTKTLILNSVFNFLPGRNHMIILCLLQAWAIFKTDLSILFLITHFLSNIYVQSKSHFQHQ